MGLWISSSYLALTFLLKWISYTHFESALRDQNIEYLQIDTRPSPLNTILWSAKFVDEKLIRNRLILSHHKHLLIGDYLIDDRRFNGASEFKSEWLHFGTERFPVWNDVLNY